jgi:hypothetical protein
MLRGATFSIFTLIPTYNTENTDPYKEKQKKNPRNGYEILEN